jgi:pimeloyl-ACP methyl ester carboxylesterase
MPDASLAQALLSLFTTRDRAESIAGDLIEERDGRGSAWFWFHVVRTTFALFTSAFASAPVKTLALVALGFALFVTLAFAGVAAVSLFPLLIGSAISWALLSFFFWSAALWTGVSLVSLAPKHGMTACLALAIAGEALLLSAALFFSWSRAPNAWSLLVSMSALFAAAPLLAGGAIVRRRTILLVLLLLLASPIPASTAQSSEWHDASPHRTTLVTVEDGVQLEVLDWGGSGRGIVLLAGLGDTAHVFDDFAPMLAKQYHVYGVTRRGHGRSSAPSTGYEFARLAEDVVRVITTLALTKPVIVGHSIAGEELHVLGARHATDVSGLVYVDAAFNRADGSEDYDAVARQLPPAPAPQATDLASVTALRAFRMKNDGAALPEAHLRARYVVNDDGSVGGAWMPALPVRQAFTVEMQRMSKSYQPERIRVPALAIYAVPKAPPDLMRPWYNADDPVVRKNVETLYELARERFRRHAQWFEAHAERGRVSELPGAHHLFITNAREVLREIDAFVSLLP